MDIFNVAVDLKSRVSRSSKGAHFSLAELRLHLSDVMNRTAYGKEQVILTRRGRPFVALVPLEDIESLEQFRKQKRRAKRGRRGGVI
jgi:prevent-host-death family protein